MKKIVALNLKMNLDYDSVEPYINTVKDRISDANEIIFFPSYLYLERFKRCNYKVGAQNVHYLDNGAFTGEISPLQLKTMGINNVLIGHSERRIHFKEDDILINNKIKGSLKNNLNIILCSGETEEERQLLKTAMIIEKQLKAAFKDIDIEDLSDIVIAYEPVWAIGTGKVPNVSEIEDALKFIKKFVMNKYGINIKVLYGGSINKNNIESIININILDGILVGTSSIDPKYLVDMLDLIN